MGEIAALAKIWSQFNREENPALTMGQEEAEALKKLASDGADRLRWRVLKAFGALPSEPRAQAMRDRDYVWCLSHLALDQEEELERLCPSAAPGQRSPDARYAGPPPVRGRGGQPRL